MKTIKVSEATGVVLDFLVSKAGNPTGKDGWGWWERDAAGYLYNPLRECRYSPTTDWSEGGPIIERERITFDYHDCNPCDQEDAAHARLSRARMKPDGTASWYAHKRGPTLLIAAMRCYVASKLGDTVEVPEDL